MLSRLSQIHRMEKRQQLEEEREQQVPGSPTIHPASPTPQPPDQSEEPTGRRRLSSNNKLQRQEKSVIEGLCRILRIQQTIELSLSLSFRR